MIELRNLHRGDENSLIRHLNDDRVTKYLSLRIPSPYTRGDAEWWIESGSKEVGVVRAIDFDGSFCGVIGAYTQNFEYSHSAEIGYWLSYDHWNRGITTVALIKFTKYIFETTDLKRLFNPVTSLNKASLKVLEKAGYKLEGVLKGAVVHEGVYVDEHLYARLRP
ncbi:GNAT family N-acetyltransferase [Microbulbifer sp. GL-2]|uniref:GNAT family N-acetyltransferase n=1 Tax=Microbulbifer sp. GL-2 TaxID=2591606 RepID=UPI00116378C7|nr:GNAT family protein [Microbulbifer sp. GL-2]BBM03210.1 N-acetyltransferase [Microbulbifer sp. GL-2]